VHGNACCWNMAACLVSEGGAIDACDDAGSGCAVLRSDATASTAAAATTVATVAASVRLLP
jgi:hypothetical protein